MLRRRQSALTALVGAALLLAMLVVLAGHREEFADAMDGIAYWTLAAAVALHVTGLVARSEAWTVCVRAAGATISRRCAYQVASLGFAANIITTSLGTAVRIAALRRVAPDRTPKAPTLVAAEVPALAIQIAFGAAMSFTLVGPLDAPWWTPLAVLAAAALLLLGLRRLAVSHTSGVWQGLAVLRCRRDRLVVGGSVGVVIGCQIARNILLLHAVGLPASPLDATAMLIGVGVLGALPVGPGTGAGAAMLIFGAEGVGPAAAAGVLLTATGVVGDLFYAAWGGADAFWRNCPVRSRVLPRAVDVVAGVVCVGVAASVAGCV